MAEINHALVLDFVAWIAERPRRYAEAMDAWRTSCPRLTIWEDAIEAGYLAREIDGGAEALIVVTPRGRRFLAENDRLPPSG